VSLVRRLYEQFRQLIHEGAKFLVVGGIGLIVTNGVYDLLRTSAGLGPITSTTIATIVATMVTYVGNRYWSFRHRERQGVAREGVVFIVLNGIGLLIQDAVVGFNAYVLGLEHNRVAGFLALNAGIALGTLFRFWSYRRWVWAAPASAAPLTPARHPEVAAASAPAPGGRTGAGTGGMAGSALGQPGGHGQAVNGHRPQLGEPGPWQVRRR
jgi:putative flippase GtrA